MQRSKTDNLLLVFLLAAVVFIGLAIIGAFQAYSPVPFWDMWDGYLDFFTRVNSGDWSVWFAQHNEHRIVISRILFWVDLSWFGGTGLFLIAANYCLLGLVCFVFWTVAKEICPRDYRFIGLFLIVWLSSWSQKENLIWGFQSQFILAQLLPLIAFFLLYRAIENNERTNSIFFAACLLGVLSLGTMANGVLALPLMTAFALITGFAWRKIVFLAVLSIVGVFAYFYAYEAPSYHGSVLTTLRETPVGLIRYVLLYIGGPFYHFLGNKGLSMLAGATLVTLSSYFAWKSLRKPRKNAIQLALLTFILYVGGTALATAGGRLIFGEGSAFSSRYMTPALMAWAAFFLILAPRLVRFVEPNRWKLLISLLVFILIMLPMQLKALHSKTKILFERNVAALALEMRIKDQEQIEYVYPSIEKALSIATNPSDKNISIFAHPLIRDVREQIGKPIVDNPDAYHSCQGNIDNIEQIANELNYMRISGWIFDGSEKRAPKFIWVTDPNGVAVGYALVGIPRRDIAAAISEYAHSSGFKGYFQSQNQGLPMRLYDPVSRCSLSF